VTETSAPPTQDKPAPGPWRQGGLLSPRFFTDLAVIWLVLYFVLHLAGLRGYASILSGTIPSAHATQGIYLGTAYVILYFLAVVGTPILLLAAVLMYGVRRTVARHGK
jgi:hypothetical protein